MSRVFLNVFSFFLGAALLSSCVDSVKLYGTLEKVEQNPENVIAHVAMGYTGPPSISGVGSDLAVFKFIDQKGKDYWLRGNCNCMTSILRLGEIKMLQYKIPKTDLPKGIYKVYLTARRQIKPNEYKTIEIK